MQTQYLLELLSWIPAPWKAPPQQEGVQLPPSAAAPRHLDQPPWYAQRHPVWWSAWAHVCGSMQAGRCSCSSLSNTGVAWHSQRSLQGETRFCLCLLMHLSTYPTSSCGKRVERKNQPNLSASLQQGEHVRHRHNVRKPAATVCQRADGGSKDTSTWQCQNVRPRRKVSAFEHLSTEL